MPKCTKCGVTTDHGLALCSKCYEEKIANPPWMKNKVERNSQELSDNQVNIAPSKNKTTIHGILIVSNNPFVENKYAWIEQGYGLTEHRNKQLLSLLDKTVQEIMEFDDENDTRYVAFIAVRWGFAEVIEGVLKRTGKLDDYKSYDEWGLLKE